ncbi:MAG: hypothetical protein QOE90_2416 [Thermoplasmata archaeon]|nr:hypothetical protein [Thermoplasmata archaeon]
MGDSNSAGLRGASLLLLLIACAGLATASPGTQGSLTVAGSVTFPAESAGSMAGVVLLVPHTDELGKLTISTALLHACGYEHPQTEVAAGSFAFSTSAPTAKDKVTCSDFSHARVGLTQGNQSGWLGAHLDGASCAFSPVQTGARASGDVVSPDIDTGSTATDDAPSWPHFLARFTSPYLLTETRGAVSCTGRGTVKLNGPDVEIATPEGVTPLRTGDNFTSDAPVHGRNVEWAWLEFENATLDVGDVGAVVAGTTATATWDGRLSFEDAQGNVTTADTLYSATRGPAWVDGAMSGTLKATSGAVGLDFQGAFRGTSIQGTHMPAPPPLFPRARSIVPAATLGGLILGSALAGGYYVRRRRGRRVAPVEPRLSLAERAALAADSGNWLMAVDLYPRAIAHEPRRGDLRADYGMALVKLGRYEEAERAFDEAAHYLESGEAERWAAMCAVWRQQPQRAPIYLARGLSRTISASLVARIEQEPELASVVDDPLVRGALEAARARLAALA